MKNRDYIVSLSAYPIPANTIEAICTKRGIDVESTFIISDSMKLVEADVYAWLSNAPSVTQGGISYNLSDADKQYYRYRSQAIYDSLGDTSNQSSNYGYQGDRL